MFLPLESQENISTGREGRVQELKNCFFFFFGVCVFHSQQMHLLEAEILINSDGSVPISRFFNL